MAAQALYSRWRPMTFEEVVGQEHVTYTLRNALLGERVGHAYLFSGPRGTGKTTMARLLAKAVNCLHEDPAGRPCNTCAHCLAANEGRFLDLIEIDAASHTGVDDVRELRERIAFAPNEGRYKVYVVDEVHRFSGAAFDALLKTIEEPPAHAIFVLATTEIHKVPQTILSRCQRFDFRRLSFSEIVARLRTIADAEGIAADDAALQLIARQATGSLRDAISLLDQLISGPEQALTLELAQAILGTAASQAVRDLVSAVLYGDVALGLDVINRTLDEGTDARQFARQVVEYLRLVMLVQTGSTDLVGTAATPDEIETIAVHAEQYPRRALLATLRAFNDAASDIRGSWQPQLPLEIALVESVEALYSGPTESPAPALASPPTQPADPAQPQTGQPREASGEGADDVPPGGDTITTADIHARWNQVLQVARQLDPPGVVQALLRVSSLHSVEGQAVIVQVPSDVLRAKIEDEANRRLIETALQQVFGLHLTIRCRVYASQAQGQPNRVEGLLARDSLASFAVNELGGRITSIEDEE